MQPVILLVDDDPAIVKVNREFLLHEDFVVFCAYDARSALDILKKQNIDCIVLDIMLPNTSGFELVSQFRPYSKAPILFLSAISDVSERVKGLTIGDDYLVKPYDLNEMVARIRLLLRHTDSASDEINLYPLILQLSNHSVTLGGEDVFLTPTEFILLYRLAKTPNVCVSMEEIDATIWKSRTVDANRNIMVYISSIRKKLFMPPENYRFIESVRGKGYMLLYPPKRRESDDVADIPETPEQQE